MAPLFFKVKDEFIHKKTAQQANLAIPNNEPRLQRYQETKSTLQ